MWCGEARMSVKGWLASVRKMERRKGVFERGKAWRG